MDPSTAYDNLSRHLKHLLLMDDTEAWDGQDSFDVCWKIPAHRAADGKGFVKTGMISGGVDWFTDLFSSAALTLSWTLREDADQGTVLARWQFDVAFQPKKDCFHDFGDGTAWLIGLPGKRDAKLLVEGVRIGDHRFALDGLFAMDIAYGEIQKEPNMPRSPSVLKLSVKGATVCKMVEQVNSATFFSVFGNAYNLVIQFRLEHTTKYNAVATWNTEMIKQLEPSKRELDLIAHIQKCLQKKCEGTDFVVVSSDNKEYFVTKQILAENSPVFDRCFQNKDVDEVKNNRYRVPFRSVVVEKLLVYCHTRLLPSKQALSSTTKMAHQYEMHDLLKLCELHSVTFIQAYMPILSSKNGEKYREVFGYFTYLLEIATLLNLELLLAFIHLALIDVEPQLMRGPCGEEWLKFSKREPDFNNKRYAALENLLKVEAPKDNQEQVADN